MHGCRICHPRYCYQDAKFQMDGECPNDIHFVEVSSGSHNRWMVSCQVSQFCLTAQMSMLGMVNAAPPQEPKWMVA
jgi:hypothetical protein